MAKVGKMGVWTRQSELQNPFTYTGFAVSGRLKASLPRWGSPVRVRFPALRSTKSREDRSPAGQWRFRRDRARSLLHPLDRDIPGTTRNGSIPIVGAWRLVEFTVEGSDFGEIHPLGDAAQGSLICTDVGPVLIDLL